MIFVDPLEGLKDHPEIFKKWFGKVIPSSDNKFSALNSARFQWRSFIYLPPGEGSNNHSTSLFQNQCRKLPDNSNAPPSLPMKGLKSLTWKVVPLQNSKPPHFIAAVVELVALKGAKIQYITVQNWSNNAFNLVTKRALAQEEAKSDGLTATLGLV